MRLLAVLCLALLLGSCSSPEVATPAPTQQAILFTYPADLQPWADKLSACASSNPLVAPYFSQSPGEIDATFFAQTELSLGEPSQLEPGDNLFRIGWEQIVVVINKDNPLSELSLTRLRSIFIGQEVGWDNEAGSTIQVWVLPDGDAARSVFERAVLLSQSLAPDARLAPNPGAMLEAVSKDANAIGYLPASFLQSGNPLSGKVKPVQVDASLDKALLQPVIALTHGEPQGQLHELLVCLQDQGQ